jgi:hypothetical protein
LGGFYFQAGELILAEARYCHSAGIATVLAANAKVCVRLSPHGLPLFDQPGKLFSAVAAACQAA